MDGAAVVAVIVLYGRDAALRLGGRACGGLAGSGSLATGGGFWTTGFGLGGGGFLATGFGGWGRGLGRRLMTGGVGLGDGVTFGVGFGCGGRYARRTVDLRVLGSSGMVAWLVSMNFISGLNQTRCATSETAMQKARGFIVPACFPQRQHLGVRSKLRSC